MVGRNVECHLPSLDDAIIDNCPAGYQQAQVISPCSLLDFKFGSRYPQTTQLFGLGDQFVVRRLGRDCVVTRRHKVVNRRKQIAVGISFEVQFT